jgi:wobble nucleotide-excising tRNase
MKEESKLPLQNTDVVDNIYKSLYDIIQNEKITTDNIIVITTRLMKIVEQYSDLNGSKKKVIVIRVMKRIVRDTLEGESDSLISFIDMFLPSIIDTLIAVDKKELVFKIVKKLKICFPWCK